MAGWVAGKKLSFPNWVAENFLIIHIFRYFAQSNRYRYLDRYPYRYRLIEGLRIRIVFILIRNTDDGGGSLRCHDSIFNDCPFKPCRGIL